MEFKLEKKHFVLSNVKVATIENAINSYQEVEKKPTFTGLLTKLMLTYEDFQRLKRSDSPQVKKAVRLLELYRQHLESEMEKKLIYQENLPKFYDKRALQFVLTKSNPERYGEKVITENSISNAKTINWTDLTNTSGVNLNKSNNGKNT